MITRTFWPLLLAYLSHGYSTAPSSVTNLSSANTTTTDGVKEATVDRSSASDRDSRTYSDPSWARDPPSSQFHQTRSCANGTREEQVCRRQFDWRVLCTGYGVDLLLSDRNVGRSTRHDNAPKHPSWHSA
jgi:hypothetical protein